MSLLKKLVGLTIGAAAVGAAAYFLNRNEHTEEYEHIWGPEDEVEPETDSAEPAADDASAEGLGMKCLQFFPESITFAARISSFSF